MFNALFCKKLKNSNNIQNSKQMKTIKFIFYFNLFFYTGMIFTISIASLLVYNIGFNSYKSLIINFHSILPYLLLSVNFILISFIMVKSILKYSELYVANLIAARKKRNDFISVENISFSN